MAGVKRDILWPVFGAALAVRAVFLHGYLASPFRAYHLVPGLDMQTMLRFSEWDNGEFPPLFVIHRVIIAAVRAFNGFEHSPVAVAVIQCLIGAVGAVLVGDIALRLWRRRLPALAAGLLTALYGPLVMYDFTMLQESVAVNFTLFGFWTLVRARDFRFSPGAVGLVGAALGLATVGRPTALPLVAGALVWTGIELHRRRLPLSRLLSMAGGVAAVWAAATFFNGLLAGYWSCFFNVVPYTLQFNAPVAEAAGTAPGTGTAALWRQTFANMAVRIPQLFQVAEIPENLNYYFLKLELPMLRRLIGPALLVPAAVAGLFALFCAPRLLRRNGVLLLPLLMAPVLCVRDPIGRYRLMLIPYFALYAVWLGVWTLGRPWNPRRLASGGALAAGCFALLWWSSPGPLLRSSDYVCWGAALEALGDRPAAVKYYRTAWVSGGFSNQAAAVRLLVYCYDNRLPEAMAKVVDEGLSTGQVSPSLLCYYGGIAEMGMRHWQNAARFLDRVDETEIPELAGKFNFIRALVFHELGKTGLSRKYLRSALDCGLPENLRREAEKRLREQSR